jgi:hypothetical protein
LKGGELEGFLGLVRAFTNSKVKLPSSLTTITDDDDDDYDSRIAS